MVGCLTWSLEDVAVSKDPQPARLEGLRLKKSNSGSSPQLRAVGS
jgi:hypothetical protein